MKPYRACVATQAAMQLIWCTTAVNLLRLLQTHKLLSYIPLPIKPDSDSTVNNIHILFQTIKKIVMEITSNVDK